MRSKQQDKKIGAVGESVAVAHLEQRGYSIVSKNFSCKLGEIDIIAQRDDTICFIEVKSRRGMGYGRPGEAVTANKQKHIRQTATYFLFTQWHNLPVHEDTAFRFDVMEILYMNGAMSVEHIENAFF
jgi:putative endonuclease